MVTEQWPENDETKEINSKRDMTSTIKEESSGDDGIESWDGSSISNREATVSFGEIRGISSSDDDMLRDDDVSSSPEDIPQVVLNPGRLLRMIFGCARWSRTRIRGTVLGCVSSVAVLAIRLYLDFRPTAYLIHSIIVFFDMILIHMFTKRMWISISGELVTIAMFLLFHFTKETLWELLETVLLAMLCSFHMIGSRNKHLDHEKELEHDLRTLCHQTSCLLESQRHADSGNSDRIALHRQQSSRHLERMRSRLVNWNSDRTIDMEPHDNDHVEDLNVVPSRHAKKAKVWGENFFEHFLDGSAGVMVSSNLLIGRVVK
jgi:hypothetical protein